MTTRTDTAGGPVLPTENVRVALRPLPLADVEFRSGLLAEWQRRNRDVTIPAGIEWLSRAGNMHNLRLVTGEESGEYVGPFFMDSDVYKTLEAVGWELGRERSAGLEEFVAESTDLLRRVQEDDGYVDSWFQAVARDERYTNLAFGHEMYCAGHLVQAGIAVARATGDEALLGIARRFVDNIDAVFGSSGRMGTPGHPEIEMALVELYRYTGERRYVDLAARLVDARGHGALGPGRFGSAYYQDHVPVRDATTVAGHAVRALYLQSGLADLAAETGDEALLEVLRRQWTSMVGEKLYLTGGVGSRHFGEAFGEPYELPPDRAYNETCAAIASIMWSWRMLLLTGEGRYAELIERTLYNAFAAGVSLDGDAFFYVNPLHFRGEGHLPTPREVVTHGSDLAKRAHWFDCACCPPNVMRIMSSLHHYVATVSADGMQLHQYFDGTVGTCLPGGDEVGLDVASDYPWTGDVTVHVTRAPERPWEFALRIPSWAEGASAYVNDVEVMSAQNVNGYLALRREWRPGDAVRLRMPMTPRLTVADSRVDAVRGSAAIERGPLVYCVEQADLAPGIAPDEIVMRATAPQSVDAAPVDVDSLGRTIRLAVPGAMRADPPTGGLYRSIETTEQAEQARGGLDVVAVPYFQWANREPGAMRVWLPSDDSK